MESKKGFSLLELTLVLGIGAAIAFIKFQDMRSEQENINADIAGQQIKRLGYAVNNYISLRYDKLSTLTNAAGTGTDPGPRICSGSICTITYQTLINEGILPTGYVPKNSFSSTDYSIQLKRSGVSPNYVIDGVILTNGAWIEGGNIRYDLLGKAMQSAGIDSAATKTATQLNSFGGSWTLQQSDYTSINKQGLLGFRVGYNASLYSAFLRRDGTLPMTGNLNMGANDIINAKDITASGTGTFGSEGYFGSNVNSGGTITAAGQVIAHNGYGDKIAFGGDGAGGDYEIRLDNGTKPLSIYSPNAGDYTTVLNVYKNTQIQQRLATNGLNPNDIPPGFSAGGVRTVDVIATGSFYSILAGTTAAEGKYAFYARQDGNVKASGNMTVDGRIKTGEYLEIGSVVNAGTSCSTVGLLGRDSAGQVLSCKGGIWNPEMPVGIPQPWPSATIPAGWLECNGTAFDKNKYPLLAKAYPSGVLPDLRGQFIRGLDNGRGRDAGRTLLSEQRASVVTGTDDNWGASDVGALHGPSWAYSRDTINVYDYTTGSNGQDPKYYISLGTSTTGPSLGTSESGIAGIPLVNNGSNSFYGGARPANTAFIYIVRAL